MCVKIPFLSSIGLNICLHSLAMCFFTASCCIHSYTVHVVCIVYADVDSWQWEAVSVGQAACSSEGEGKQGAHLLTDGENVGHTRRVHATEALSLPGQHIP